MSGYPMKPQVSREPNGNISLFIGGAHKQLTHEQAQVLSQLLTEALAQPSDARDMPAEVRL